MKRHEAEELLYKIVFKHTGYRLRSGEDEYILDDLLFHGFRPPVLPEEIQQAIMHIYYAGYTLNQFEEDALMDPLIAAELQRRRAPKTPKKRMTRTIFQTVVKELTSIRSMLEENKILPNGLDCFINKQFVGSLHKCGSTVLLPKDVVELRRKSQKAK